MVGAISRWCCLLTAIWVWFCAVGLGLNWVILGGCILGCGSYIRRCVLCFLFDDISFKLAWMVVEVVGVWCER